MRMLNEADENDVSVSWQDQQQINSFSRYNSRLSDVEYDLKMKRDEKEAIDDLSMEVELVDEDESVAYKVGGSAGFVQVKQPTAIELIEKDKDEIEKEIEKLEAEADACNEGMKKLKVELYAKFGNNINLERN